MKKNITKLAIAYISIAFAQSISAETLTLKTGADNVITEWWNWSDTSKWSPTVSEVAGNDLTLNINNGSVKLSSTINPGFHAGNVSISVVNPKEHVFFDVEGDAEFESLNLSQSSKEYYGTYLRVLTGHTLTINGDVNIQASSAYSPNAISFGDTVSYSSGMGDYNGNIHITGNLNLKSNIGDAWFSLKFQNFGNGLTVDGIVNTNERDVNDRNVGVEWRIDADSTRIGGLQGSNLFGNNKLSVNENKSDRTLTFTNKSGVATKWSGGIINGENKLNIVMDKSAAGYQELDITSGTINDITLNGGTFYISSVSDTTGTLLVDGGFYNVIGNGAKFANISLSSGGFIFEGGAMENGYTVSAGNIAKAGVEKIVVDFNGIYAPDYGDEYVLISADAIDSSLNIEDANADFVAKNLYDGYAIFKWAENQGKYVLSVTFSEVPEPAAISAIFGALALFLAFKRRER